MSEKDDVLILAIESSCDETAAAVVKNGREVLSNVINTQIAIHTEYGGVVPEIASRKHIENINPVIRKALEDAGVTLDDIDESELKEYFIEFDKHDDCRFGSRCIHENEPSCAVKEAVENGEISKKRYESYIQLLNEIRSGKRRY